MENLTHMTTPFAQLLETSEVSDRLGYDNRLGFDIYADRVNLTPVKSEEGITLYLNKETERVDHSHYGFTVETTVNKLRFELIDIVTWLDHPLTGLMEMAIEEGEMDEDDEPSEELVTESESLLKEWIEDSFQELTGEEIEVISESDSFSVYGGWVVTARLKRPYSLARSSNGSVKARPINFTR